MFFQNLNWCKLSEQPQNQEKEETDSCLSQPPINLMTILYPKEQ